MKTKKMPLKGNFINSYYFLWIGACYFAIIMAPSMLFTKEILSFNILNVMFFILCPLYQLAWFVFNVVYAERKGSIIIDYYEIYENFDALKNIKDKKVLWILSFIFGGIMSYFVLGLVYVILFAIYSMWNTKIEDFLLVFSKNKGANKI